MSNISNPDITFDNEDAGLIRQRLGAKFARVLTLRDRSGAIDISAWDIIGVIDEIDTPVGTKPEDGYDLVSGGESWKMNIENSLIIKRPEFTAVGRIIVIIPGDLGKLIITNESDRTAPPRDQPQPGLSKYYQYGFYFDSKGNTAFEIVGIIETQYSVVNQ